MDIEVFPHRVLGADTTENLLNGIEGLDDVKRTIIQGPRLPPEDTNEDPKYHDRRRITVNGKELELKVKTGRIFARGQNADKSGKPHRSPLAPGGRRGTGGL